MPNFKLELVTPDAMVYSGEVTSVSAPAEEGRIGILAGHAPLCCTLSVGEVFIREANGQIRSFVVGDGFLEVSGNTCRILAAVGEPVEAIDIARAEAAERRARERLKARHEQDFDLARAETALVRAVVRLKLGRERSSKRAR
ncbi:MAG: ATP synthase F1 subunit epsilon [Planctomycetes bacterium]|nr:ATP synthase F1 subunit epsilon [Planctomycetota bacterium]